MRQRFLLLLTLLTQFSYSSPFSFFSFSFLFFIIQKLFSMLFSFFVSNSFSKEIYIKKKGALTLSSYKTGESIMINVAGTQLLVSESVIPEILGREGNDVIWVIPICHWDSAKGFFFFFSFLLQRSKSVCGVGQTVGRERAGPARAALTLHTQMGSKLWCSTLFFFSF